MQGGPGICGIEMIIPETNKCIAPDKIFRPMTNILVCLIPRGVPEFLLMALPRARFAVDYSPRNVAFFKCYRVRDPEYMCLFVCTFAWIDPGEFESVAGGIIWGFMRLLLNGDFGTWSFGRNFWFFEIWFYWFHCLCGNAA